MKSPITSSHYHSTTSPLPCSYPCLPLVGSLWRGPADHAESASVCVCVFVCVFLGGGGGVSRRFHAVSDVRVCNQWSWCPPSPSLPWHALWNERRGQRHTVGFIQLYVCVTVCVCVGVVSVRRHIIAEVDCLGLQWQLERTNPHHVFIPATTPHPPVLLKAALTRQLNASLPSSTSYYITLSLAPPCSATSVGFAMTPQLLFIGFYQSLLRLISVIVEGFIQRPLVDASAANMSLCEENIQNEALLLPLQLCVCVCVLVLVLVYMHVCVTSAALYRLAFCLNLPPGDCVPPAH